MITIRLELKKMPFDKDGFHATGYRVFSDINGWYTEYENDDELDSDHCIYESEWDEEE